MLSRRHAIVGIPSVAATIAFDFGGARGAGDLQLSKDEQLEAFIRLKADLSGEPVGIYYQADLFWYQADKVMPILARCEGYSWNNVTKRSDGAYDVKLHEVGYYLDRRTGDVLSEITLSATNRSHKVEPHFTSKSSYVLGSEELTVPAFADRSDVTLDLQIRPAVSLEDTLIVHEDLQSEFIPTRTGRIERDDGSAVDENAGTRRVSQLTSFTGNLEQALDPAATYVPATSSSMMFSDTGIFIFDLEEPLPVAWRLFGQKVRTPANVSSSFKDLVDREYSSFWTNPEL